MMPVILLSGVAGSGKDTVADMICKIVPGAKKIAQSDAMKDFAAEAFGLTKKQLWDQKEKERPFVWKNKDPNLEIARKLLERLGLRRDILGPPLTNLIHWRNKLPRKTTPRHILQTLGTEWGRSIDPLMWAKETWRRANTLLVEGAPLVVITDGRFRNEILYAHYQSGWVIRIVRPNAGLKGKAKKHASESEQATIPSHWLHYTLNNNGSLKLLEDSVRWGVENVFKVEL